jgi:hypothetical protein
MADFGVAKVGPTFLLAANTAAAKELCNKVIPPGAVQTGPTGALIFPPSQNDLLCKVGRAVLYAGLSLEDIK